MLDFQNVDPYDTVMSDGSYSVVNTTAKKQNRNVCFYNRVRKTMYWFINKIVSKVHKYRFQALEKDWSNLIRVYEKQVLFTL